MFLNDYPYTDFHELNADWLIKSMVEFGKKLNDFISLNTIKYADPIEWNISGQYEANTVVVDTTTGIAYLSTKAVPSGVSITNTDYWTPIFDLSPLIDYIGNIRNAITVNDETGNITASKDYVIGDLLWYGDDLYVVVKDIAEGNAFIFDGVNTNLIKTTLERQIEVVYYPNDKKLTLHGKISDYHEIVTPGDYHVYNPSIEAIEIRRID